MGKTIVPFLRTFYQNLTSMNLKFKMGMVALCSALMFTLSTGCDKDKDTDDDTENPSNPNNPNTPTNVLCDGNGTASFFPLVQQNEWKFKGSGSSNNIDTWKINGTESYNGNTYLQVNVTWNGGFSESTKYFRVAANNDVYQYSDYYGTGQEYLLVPAAPTLNQQWTFPVSSSVEGEAFRKVTAVNKSLSVGNCSYTGLVEIKEYRNASNLLTTYWYKKGLGMVRYNSLTNTDLQSVTLK